MRFPLDLVACPVCHTQLEDLESTPHCPGCGRAYAHEKVLDLTPNPPPGEEVLSKWPLWEALQANFVSAATTVPEHSLSVSARPDAEAFARFCELSGAVLDVGCGIQRLPTYADLEACRFVGIDPLSGSEERDFEFVQGLGEYLPFRSDCLDQVLFATSLDHMLVPSLALGEAQRVIRPGGSVNVWFGELGRDDGGGSGGLLTRTRRRAGALVDRLRAETPGEPSYVAALPQPEGAVDKFHAHQPGASEIEAWFGEVGLELAAIERIEFASGCFMRGTKPG